MRTWFCSRKPWLSVMPSHNTNASHLEGPLCHFLTTSLPGVVIAVVILQLYHVFWFTKHLHLHVLTSSSHQPWRKMRCKLQFIQFNTGRPGKWRLLVRITVSLWDVVVSQILLPLVKVTKSSQHRGWEAMTRGANTVACQGQGTV